MLKGKQLVIFDWDGTLVDSVSHITDSLSYAAEKLALPSKEKSELKNVIGLGMKEAITGIYPEIGDADIDVFRQHYADYFFTKPTRLSDFFSGAIEFVERLRVQGYKVAVATGKSRRGMDGALQSTGVSHLFDYTRCADESKSKPDPQMLYDVLSFFGLRAEQAVMLGDTVYDLEMAQAAGMDSIAVTFGVHGRDELARYEPKASIESYAQILGGLCLE